MLYKLIQLQLN